MEMAIVILIAFGVLFAFLFAEEREETGSIISFLIAVILSIWLTAASIQEDRFDVVGTTEIGVVELEGIIKNVFIRDGEIVTLDDVYNNPENHIVELLERQNWYLGIRFMNMNSHRVIKREE